MPLQLSPMEEQDIPAFAEVDDAAMAGWAYAEAMMPPNIPRKASVEQWTRSSWGADPSQHWLKITDTDLDNELIAAALWTSVPEGNARPAYIPENEKQETPAEDPNLISPMWAESRRMGREFDEEYVGDVSRLLLMVLVCHPKHQRRGAGRVLVEWGCRKADEAGCICVLTSSEKGEKLYLDAGFEIRKTGELDLRPYGYDHTELRRYMIRQPQKRAT